MALSQTVSGEKLESGYADHPDHKISVEKAPVAVFVEYGARAIAESKQALVLRETGYPLVYYLPRTDIDAGAFIKTQTTFWCPFKGRASYFSLEGAGDLGDVAWSYEDPFTEVAPIAGYVAFYGNKVTVRA